jgi:hypothetical protein
LDTLIADRGNALLATAVLLTGSRAGGEDLLQAALERLMRQWSRVRGDKEARSTRPAMASASASQNGPTGRADQCPALSAGGANTEGLSKRGKHSQSTEPCQLTSAAEWRSDSNA